MTYDDEYRLILNQVNILTERRQTVASTYLTVTTAIIAGVAFLFKDGDLESWQQEAAVLVLLFAGFLACNLWRAIVSQYSTLLDWWYKELRRLEEENKESSMTITREYDELYKIEGGKVKVGITRYEKTLTWIFGLLFFVFACALLLDLLRRVF